MNDAKRPQFIKALPHHNLLLADESDSVTIVVLDTLIAAGIDSDEPVYTVDGDRVRLLMVDPLHTFPIVGEVVDFEAEVTWIARWSASGVYASSSPPARKSHSLAPNVEVGQFTRVEAGESLPAGCVIPAGEYKIISFDEYAPFVERVWHGLVDGQSPIDQVLDAIGRAA